MGARVTDTDCCWLTSSLALGGIRAFTDVGAAARRSRAWAQSSEETCAGVHKERRLSSPPRVVFLRIAAPVSRRALGTRSREDAPIRAQPRQHLPTASTTNCDVHRRCGMGQSLWPAQDGRGKARQ